MTPRTRKTKAKATSSQVELVSGEIGIDIAHYLEQSEQTRSAVLLGVLARPDGLVAAAGGMVVEVLPGAPDEAIELLEANIAGIGGVSELLEQGFGFSVMDDPLPGHGYDREDMIEVLRDWGWVGVGEEPPEPR